MLPKRALAFAIHPIARWAWPSLAAASGVALLCFSPAPAGSAIGAGLVALGAMTFASALHAKPRVPAARWTLAGCLAVAGLATQVLWPVALGRMPITQDHRVHLFRAWHFVNERLLHGKVSGWSSDWFAGWPAGEDYPPGGDFWVTLFRLLTFPASWEASYAWAFLALYVFVGCSFIAFARNWGVVTGVLAASLWIYDPGAYREGGFNYTVYFGVWPQQLASGSVLFGLAAFWRYLDCLRSCWLAVSALLFGGALLCHPFTLIALGAALPPLALVHGRRAASVASWFLIAIVLGYAVSGFYQLPFAARSAWMATVGAPWKPLEQVVEALGTGKLYFNGAPIIVWSALAGFLLGVIRRDRRAVFLGLWSTILAVGASSTITDSETLRTVSDKAGQVQWQRIIIALKFPLFLLASYPFGVLLHGVVVRSGRVGSAARFALAVAIATLALPAYETWQSEYFPGRVQTAERANGGRDMRRFIEWSREQRKRTNAFYRIAYEEPFNSHTFAAAPIENRTPSYKAGYTPASVYIHKPDQARAELYEVLSVRYVLAKHALSGPAFELLERFGNLRLYRFTDYVPERWTLEGPGTVSAERFDEEYVRLRLSGTDATTRLVLHVAHYPKWRATLDGEPVPIEVATLADEPVFMRVPANGTVLTFAYRSLPVDVVSWVLTALGLLGSGALWFVSYRLPNIERHARLGWAAGGALMLAIAVHRVVRGPATPTWSLARDGGLENASVQLERGGAAPRVCPLAGSRFNCSHEPWNYVGPTVQLLGGLKRSCVWAHPVNHATLRVTLPEVMLGNQLVLLHGLTDSGANKNRKGAPVHLRLALDGEQLARVVRPNRMGWDRQILDVPAGPHELIVEITTPHDANREYCFDIQTGSADPVQ